MVRTETLAALAALTLSPALALYTSTSPVLQLDSNTYDSLIAKSNHTSIVEFYAPWCGHCQKLAPAYEKAAKSLKGLAKVASVDCDVEKNKPFCGSMGVQGFPTLKIVRPGKKSGRPSVEDYRGERSAKAIVDAVIDKIPNHVKRLKDSDYEEWMAESGPKAILFTDKGIVSALLKSVAIDFLGVLNVGQIRNKETEAIEAFSVERFPTLLLLPGEGKDPIIYDGELKKEPIVKFLSQVASPNPDPAPNAKASKSSTNKAKASKSSSKFAKASASHAASEAQEEAASQIKETIIDDPTDSPSPQVDTQKPAKVSDSGPANPIASLQEGLSLQQECLNDKAGTCVLALLPEETSLSVKTIQAIRALSELHKKHESASRNLFPFYQIPHGNSQGIALRSKLSLSPTEVEVIAINGKRSWWRHYTQETFSIQSVEDWVDAIRMGDSKKLDVPSGLIVDRTSLPSEPVMVNIPAGGEEGPFGKGPRGTTPEGVEYEMEEISDEEYERLMNQAKQAPADEHDEL